MDSEDTTRIKSGKFERMTAMRGNGGLLSKLGCGEFNEASALSLKEERHKMVNIKGKDVDE